MLGRGSGNRPNHRLLIIRSLPLVGGRYDGLQYTGSLHLEGLRLAVLEVSGLDSLTLEVDIEVATHRNLNRLAIEEDEDSRIGLRIHISILEQATCATRRGYGRTILQQNTLPRFTVVVAGLPVAGLALHYNAHERGVTLLTLHGELVAVVVEQEIGLTVLRYAPIVGTILVQQHSHRHAVLTGLTGLTVSDRDLLAIGEIDLIARLTLDDFRYIDIVLHSLDKGTHTDNVLIQGSNRLLQLQHAVLEVVNAVVDIRIVILASGEEHTDGSHQIE